MKRCKDVKRKKSECKKNVKRKSEEEIGGGGLKNINIVVY